MRLVSTLSLALLALACERPPAVSTLEETRAAIEAQNAKFSEALRAGDAAAIAALYTEDGRVLPPNGPAASGRGALAAFWGGVIGAGIADATLTTEEVSFAGDLAAEVGRATLTARDGSVADEVKYIVLWKRVDGVWRLHRDIWNSNRAAAPATAPDALPSEGAAPDPAGS